MRYLALIFLSSVLVACSDPDKTKTTDDVPAPSLVGKWNNTHLDAIATKNGKIEESVSIDTPFTGSDLVEWLRFTTDSVYIKIGNEDSEMDPIRYFYRTAQMAVVITDGIDTDTLVKIDQINTASLRYSYSERDTVDGDVYVKTYNYKAVKQ
jgi:hypothetical protein